MDQAKPTIFTSLLESPVYSIQSARFELSGRHVASKMDPVLIHRYEIKPPKSIIEFGKTIEKDVFVLQIVRIIEDGWSLNSHYHYSEDINVFKSLIDYDYNSMFGKLRVANDQIEEEYDFKILKPGHIQKTSKNGKYIESVSTTYIICGSMIPIPIDVPIIEPVPVLIEPEERDRFDMLFDDEES